MDYQEFKPCPELQAFVKLYWTLQVPHSNEHEKQLILPDGCLDMAFLLGDDIKRYVSDDEFVIGPRQSIIGQITKQYYIQPVGCVDSFSVRFYPYGFCAFSSTPLHEFANTETPLDMVFGKAAANKLSERIIEAKTTKERIEIIEEFLLSKLSEESAINSVVKSTVDSIINVNGSSSIKEIFEHIGSSRRQMERHFMQQIGISPKQLGKVVRLQSALKMILNQGSKSLTDIAYDSDYYDQNHFIRDFKSFTGVTPKKFLGDKHMELSSVLYGQEVKS